MSKKTILITGTSTGFGLDAVQRLLARGHTVIAGVRGGAARMEALAPAAWREAGPRALAVDLHMDDAKTFEAARQLVEKQGGRLDALINNAGYGAFGPVEDLAMDRIRHQLEVNFFGPVGLTQALLPALRAARGRVIQVSSVAGRLGFPFYGAYNASKFALEGLSEALALELMPLGVQVCLVEPGGFRTSFSGDKKREESWYHKQGSAYGGKPEAMQRAIARFDARLGDPARVGRLLVRLCERRRIPFRVPIGADSVALLTLSRLLPHRLRLRLVEAGYALAVYRRSA